MSSVGAAIELIGGGRRQQAARRPAGFGRPIVAAACVVIGAMMLFPVAVSLFASVKTPAELASYPPTYLPHTFDLGAYERIDHFQAGLPTYFFNSVAVAFLTIVFSLALAVPAGYGLARFPIAGKEAIFLILLLALMIPYQALLIPLYLEFARIGLTNSRIGLAIVHTVLQLPFSIYLMRHTFEALPREMEEAAVIDGCNSWQVLVWVFLPSAKAGIVTVVLFAFIASWNEFIGALIFMGKETMFTLPVMLVNAREMRLYAIDWGALQAGIIVAIGPCILVYVLLQRHYVSGLLSGAVK